MMPGLILQRQSGQIHHQQHVCIEHPGVFMVVRHHALDIVFRVMHVLWLLHSACTIAAVCHWGLHDDCAGLKLRL